MKQLTKNIDLTARVPFHIELLCGVTLVRLFTIQKNNHLFLKLGGFSTKLEKIESQQDSIGWD